MGMPWPLVTELANQIPASGSSAAPFVTKTANYIVLAGDSGTTFDNGGASGEVDFTLPAWAAGLRYIFIVATAQILKIIAPAGIHIAIGGANSVAAGNVVSSAVFSAVELAAPNGASGQWVAIAMTGTWTVN
jgi:hypothetical protein